MRRRRWSRGAVGAWLLALVVLSALVGPELVPYDPIEPDYRARFATPSAEHWLGTDNLGRDVFARALAGGRVSLVITGAATLLALTVGLVTGLAAAGLRGPVDVVLTRAFDALLAFPGFLLVLLLVAMLGGGVGQTIAALGVAGSPLYFRLTRAFTRQELQRDYVTAGIALGASHVRLLFRHALPNFAGALAVQAASTAAAFLLVEASLSYLGLGVPLPTPSWGNVLQDARAFLTRQPWAALGPGLVLATAALAFQFVADGVRDRLDRRS
ncbi:MAG: ABC transporter permease [Trueperaceae bacterium]|nr:ABC transporter permease [Trueperaceae bacterium]